MTISNFRGSRMVKTKNSLSYFWNIVKIPVFVLIAWSLIGLITQIVSFSTYMQIFGNPIVGWIVSITFFAFIGWSAVTDHKANPVQAGLAGLTGGVIVGFVAAVLSLIAMQIFPQLFDNAMKLAIAKGAPADSAKNIMMIGMYFALILAPIIQGAVGFVLSWLTGLITKSANK